MTILILVACLVLVIVLMTKTRKPEPNRLEEKKDPALSMHYGPEMDKYDAKTPSPTLTGSMARPEPVPDPKAEEQSGLPLYTFTEAKKVWICGGCEAENPETANVCVVCHCDRQGE